MSLIIQHPETRVYSHVIPYVYFRCVLFNQIFTVLNAKLHRISTYYVFGDVAKILITPETLRKKLMTIESALSLFTVT